ncbi:hypothetical protein CW304_21495 [Bacillus sp. UFRGS-B20]|nr:hypothetical protein CW304_21495 [Bacillus sp. UFRGS-B20]
MTINALSRRYKKIAQKVILFTQSPPTCCFLESGGRAINTTPLIETSRLALISQRETQVTLGKKTLMAEMGKEHGHHSFSGGYETRIVERIRSRNFWSPTLERSCHFTIGYTGNLQEAV